MSKMARLRSYIVSCFALGSYSLDNSDTTKRDNVEVELLKFARVSEHSWKKT